MLPFCLGLEQNEGIFYNSEYCSDVMTRYYSKGFCFSIEHFGGIRPL